MAYADQQKLRIPMKVIFGHRGRSLKGTDACKHNVVYALGLVHHLRVAPLNQGDLVLRVRQIVPP